MRILIHTINYSELTGPGKYATEMGEWLAARGHDVTVVTPPPYYPEWRVSAGYRAWRYSASTEAKVRVRRAPIWVPRVPSGLARVLYTLSFALSSIPLLLLEVLRRPDVIFVIEPSILLTPLAWLAARLSGACAWLHIQDFEIDLAYDLGQLRRGRSIANGIERWLVQRFDAVSSISHQMMNRARSKGVSPSRLFSLPNWFDAGKLYPLDERSSLRTKLDIPEGALVALYSGSLGAKQGVEMILDAARDLVDLPIYFVICGEGVAKQSLEAIGCGARNVCFLPLQPAENLNELLSLADIHLLPQRKGTEGSIFPSKLIGMLASGRPVVAMSEAPSEIAECVEGCGICVDYGDIDAFAGAIRELAISTDRRVEMGRRARWRALERFRQDVILVNLELAFGAERKIDVAAALANSAGHGD